MSEYNLINSIKRSLVRLFALIISVESHISCEETSFCMYWNQISLVTQGKFNYSPSDSCGDIFTGKTANVNFMVAQQEKSKDHP